MGVEIGERTGFELEAGSLGHDLLSLGMKLRASHPLISAAERERRVPFTQTELHHIFQNTSMSVPSSRLKS